MKRLVLILGLVVVPAAAAQQDDEHLTRAKRILSLTPLIDGHNDLPWAIRNFEAAPKSVTAYDLTQRTPGHTDIERLRQGMVGAQFWSVYVPFGVADEGYAKVQLEQIDIARQIIERYPDHFALALNASDVERIFGSGRIASLLGMEGGHAIENSLGALRAYFDLGARYMTLTHGSNIDWADSGTDSVRLGGLSNFGREVVREMNRLGMLVDLSHTSPGTMSDALNVAEAPVIFSHSSARGVRDHARNVPDSILVRLQRNGGVVMVTFVPSFLTADSVATLADAVRHIEHVRRVAGAQHVGIGSDFDGISSVPVGLEDVSTFPALFAELSRRGWSDEDLRLLAGENLLRVMRQAEAVARRLQRQRGPSTGSVR